MVADRRQLTILDPVQRTVLAAAFCIVMQSILMQRPGVAIGTWFVLMAIPVLILITKCSEAQPPCMRSPTGGSQRSRSACHPPRQLRTIVPQPPRCSGGNGAERSRTG
jgi:hypothetical protein